MTAPDTRRLRELAPQVLGVLVHRYGDFASAEDAVQEALITAAAWPADGPPADPLAWLIRVAGRRLANQYRADDARRRREDVAAGQLTGERPDPASGDDDSVRIMLLCCHPALAPGAAVPLTLRAVGGLTTREIAAAFLVPEATMAQRISRAKSRLRDIADDGGLGRPSVGGDRRRSVLRVLYLIYNEGYEVTAGPDLGRPDLALETLTGNPVVRLNRAVAVAMTEGPRAGLDAIADLDRQLGHHHRLSSVRAHLHEMAGDDDEAVKGFRLAAARTLNTRERDFLLIQAARVTSYGCRPPCPPPA